MPNRRKTMNQIKEIIRLKECNLSDRQIAKAFGISRTTVKRYIDKLINTLNLTYSAIKDMPDEQIKQLFTEQKKEITKYDILHEYFPYFVRELKKVGVTKRILWAEYKYKHPDGLMYSQFCYHFYEWLKTDKLTMHMEHKAGEKLFVDFAGKKLAVTDKKSGKITEVEVYVAVLGSSGLTYVEAVESQKKHDWIMVNEHTLRYIGGVPLAIVPDCLKSGVTKANRYEPDINFEYSDFAHHYGTTILPARPASPKDKALVENAVKIVYMRIYAPLRNRVFYSLEELNEAIHELLEKHNNTPFQRMKISRKELFIETEKYTLQTLPVTPYEFKSFLNLKVHYNYHICLSKDGHYYSVPYRYVGRKVRIIYTNSTVEIYHNNERIAVHRRNRSTNKYSTLDDHMPAKHKFYAKWTPEKMINWGESKGIYVKEMIESIFGRVKHPEQGFNTCLGLLSLARKYGDIRLNNACMRAVSYGAYSFKAVKNILKKGLDKPVEKEEIEINLPENHENIRGENYYDEEVMN